MYEYAIWHFQLTTPHMAMNTATWMGIQYIFFCESRVHRCRLAATNPCSICTNDSIVSMAHSNIQIQTFVIHYLYSFAQIVGYTGWSHAAHDVFLADFEKYHFGGQFMRKWHFSSQNCGTENRNQENRLISWSKWTTSEISLKSGAKRWNNLLVSINAGFKVN